MAIEKVQIPDIGDAGDVEVIEVCVAEGDTVAVDDPLIVIESDKASMDVPSPRAGRITAVKLKVGDQCKEGDLVVEIETDADDEERTDSGRGGAEADAAADEEEAPAAKSAESGKAGKAGKSGKATKDAKQDEKDAADDAEAAHDGDPEDADADADADADGDADAGSADGEDEDEGETRVEDVLVPDIGEAGDVAVIEILVAAGDTVAVDDGLVVLESDKATMEVPSTVAGKVVSIELKEGDSAEEGTLVARIEVSGAAGSAGKADAKPDSEPRSREASKSDSKSDSEPGSKADGKSGSARSDSAEPDARADPDEKSAPSAGGADAAEAESSGADVYAGPAVRKLARELGVTLSQVQGSGPKERILKEDVHDFVKSVMKNGASDAAAAKGAAATGGGIPAIPVVDFSRFGEIEQQPLSRIMKAGATNLHRSWLNVVHVTQHDDADVTELEAFRKSLKPEAERAGVKVTPLPLLMKVAAAALREFPRFNGAFAGDGEHYVLKKYFHIGFAVDTPDGLLVPVVRDVDRKGVFEIAAAISELSERARTGKLKPDDMRGGCFSISSLGAIGGTGFTPIVNAPEVAILGVSRLETRPVWDGAGFVPREMLPLSLSYDHRAINGAEAGRFLTWYVQALSDMRRLLL